MESHDDPRPLLVHDDQYYRLLPCLTTKGNHQLACKRAQLCAHSRSPETGASLLLGLFGLLRRLSGVVGSGDCLYGFRP
jgi:hypothetical protein